jgi:hypothetical protein
MAYPLSLLYVTCTPNKNTSNSLHGPTETFLKRQFKKAVGIIPFYTGWNLGINGTGIVSVFFPFPHGNNSAKYLIHFHLSLEEKNIIDRVLRIT